MAERVQREGGRGIAVAAANAGEARLVEGTAVAALRTLSDLSLLVSGELPPEGPPKAGPMPVARLPDLADLKGQRGLRRGLEVAAAGATERSSSALRGPGSRWRPGGCPRSCRRWS